MRGKWGETKLGHKGLRKIGLMQLSVVRTLQCLVKGEALVSLCPGHAAIPLPSRLQYCSSVWAQQGSSSLGLRIRRLPDRYLWLQLDMAGTPEAKAAPPCRIHR